MPRERVAPQSEVIGVIVLEDSPYCVQHQRAARTAGAVGAEATAGARKRRQSEGREREDEVPPPLTYSPMSTAEPCAWLSNTNSLRRTGGPSGSVRCYWKGLLHPARGQWIKHPRRAAQSPRQQGRRAGDRLLSSWPGGGRAAAGAKPSSRMRAPVEVGDAGHGGLDVLGDQGLTVDETVILLHPPLPSVGVSIGMWRGGPAE